MSCSEQEFEEHVEKDLLSYTPLSEVLTKIVVDYFGKPEASVIPIINYFGGSQVAQVYRGSFALLAIENQHLVCREYVYELVRQNKALPKSIVRAIVDARRYDPKAIDSHFRLVLPSLKATLSQLKYFLAMRCDVVEMHNEDYIKGIARSTCLLAYDVTFPQLGDAIERLYHRLQSEDYLGTLAVADAAAVPGFLQQYRDKNAGERLIAQMRKVVPEETSVIFRRP